MTRPRNQYPTELYPIRLTRGHKVALELLSMVLGLSSVAEAAQLVIREGCERHGITAPGLLEGIEGEALFAVLQSNKAAHLAAAPAASATEQDV